jgi:hypothetical protein
MRGRAKQLIEASEDELPWRRDNLIVNWTRQEWELWTAKMGREPTHEEFRKHIHDLWNVYCDEDAAYRAWWKAEKERRAEAEANKVVSLFSPVIEPTQI